MAFPTQSATLNGTTQYFSAADSASLSPTSDMTLEAWVKLSATPGSGSEYDIISKHDNGGGANGRSFIWSYANNGGTLGFRMRISTDGSSANQSTTDFAYTVSTGVWTHWAASYVASTGTITYVVNGVSLGTSTLNKTSIFDSATIVTIGARGDGSSEGITHFGETRLWKGLAQSASTINTNKCTTLGSTANLSAEWTLDNVLTDDSGNGNTLTNVNTATFSADVSSVCSPAVVATGSFLKKMI